jgi:hypothetical protein
VLDGAPRLRESGRSEEQPDEDGFHATRISSGRADLASARGFGQVPDCSRSALVPNVLMLTRIAKAQGTQAMLRAAQDDYFLYCAAGVATRIQYVCEGGGGRIRDPNARSRTATIASRRTPARP